MRDRINALGWVHGMKKHLPQLNPIHEYTVQHKINHFGKLIVAKTMKPEDHA